MSNEELAAVIQAGDREKLAALWDQVERFVWSWAVRYPDSGAVSREDLYQSGYLALVEAADSYDPERGTTFIGWLAFHLKTAFNEASNYRSTRQRRDPMHRADSLDRPIGDNYEVPDAKLRQLIREEVTAVQQNSGSGEINLVLNGDLAGLARILRPHLEKEGKRVGVNLVKGTA